MFCYADVTHFSCKALASLRLNQPWPLGPLSRGTHASRRCCGLPVFLVPWLALQNDKRVTISLGQLRLTPWPAPWPCPGPADHLLQYGSEPNLG